MDNCSLTYTFTLLSLPNELIVYIMLYLAGNEYRYFDLFKFNITCRHIQSIWMDNRKLLFKTLPNIVIFNINKIITTKYKYGKLCQLIRHRYRALFNPSTDHMCYHVECGCINNDNISRIYRIEANYIVSNNKLIYADIDYNTLCKYITIRRIDNDAIKILVWYMREIRKYIVYTDKLHINMIYKNRDRYPIYKNQVISYDNPAYMHNISGINVVFSGIQAYINLIQLANNFTLSNYLNIHIGVL